MQRTLQTKYTSDDVPKKRTAKKCSKWTISSQLSLPSLAPRISPHVPKSDLRSLLVGAHVQVWHFLGEPWQGSPMGFSILDHNNTKRPQPVLPLYGERKWRPWKRKMPLLSGTLHMFTWCSHDVHVFTCLVAITQLFFDASSWPMPL